MRFAVIAAMIATVSAKKGEKCGKDSDAALKKAVKWVTQQGRCGDKECCGETNTKDMVCSDKEKKNPDAVKYTSFVCKA